ncbi:MAG: hypothetical protein PHI70_05520 [Proteiniphilum sp.]|nr:hypothetical protein [Proteiniphilum sp.]MDD4416224.1 hypothetical protein [Proteiniphilum sp.]
MKKLLIITLLLSIASVVFMIIYFIASTDIYHDYVGTTIVSGGIINNVDKLPEWTTCKGEWRLLQIDLIVRLIFMLLITAILR